MEMMKRIAALLLAGAPLWCSAHPCPYDWNIEFAEPVTISGDSMKDFSKKFNEAVGKQSGGKIPQAIIYQEKPDVVTKVPGDSPFAKEMDTLVRRYFEITEPLVRKGLAEYGAGGLKLDFPAKFPVACLLAGCGGMAVIQEETKEGLRITCHRVLECRAYRVTPGFLERVEEYRQEDRVPVGEEAVSSVFASFSGMKRTVHVVREDEKEDAVETSILAGVTHYLPDKKVVLAIETKENHEEMAGSMAERGYLEKASTGGGSGKK